MSLLDKPFTFDRVIRIGIGVLILWGVIWLLGYLSDVLIPFAIAFLLAYMMNPMVSFSQRFVKKRLIAVLLSLLFTLMLLTGLIMVLIPLISDEITDMGDLISGFVQKKGVNEQALQYLPQDIWNYVQEFIQRSEVQAFFNSDKFKDLAASAVEKILPGIMGVFSGAISILVGIFGFAMIMLYLIFLLLDYDTIVNSADDLIPTRYKNGVVGLVQDFEKAMNNYFRAQALVAFIVGVLFSVGFLIIGLPMAILLGLFIGAMVMIPYLHTFGIIPAAFLALIHSLETGTNFWLVMLFVLIVFVVVQIIQDGFLVPKIMGNVTGLNPAAILLSLSIWGKLLGMLGLIIALPITYILLSYYRRFIIHSLDKIVPTSNSEENKEKTKS